MLLILTSLKDILKKAFILLSGTKKKKLFMKNSDGHIITRLHTPKSTQSCYQYYDGVFMNSQFCNSPTVFLWHRIKHCCTIHNTTCKMFQDDSDISSFQSMLPVSLKRRTSGQNCRRRREWQVPWAETTNHQLLNSEIANQKTTRFFTCPCHLQDPEVLALLNNSVFGLTCKRM